MAEAALRRRGIARARAFRRLDVDRDGLVSLEELRTHHLEVRRPPLRPEKWRQREARLRAADVDGDGRLAMEEYVAALRDDAELSEDEGWPQAAKPGGGEREATAEQAAVEEAVGAYLSRLVPGAVQAAAAVEEAAVEEAVGAYLSRLVPGAVQAAARLDDSEEVEASGSPLVLQVLGVQADPAVAVKPAGAEDAERGEAEGATPGEPEGAPDAAAPSPMVLHVVPVLKRLNSLVDALADADGYLPGWTNGRGERCHKDAIALHDVLTYIVAPAAAKDTYSDAELADEEAPAPRWFLSQWWGQTVVRDRTQDCRIVWPPRRGAATWGASQGAIPVELVA